MVETMLCYSKLEQLFHRVYPALRNFPVAEKYALSFRNFHFKELDLYDLLLRQ